MAALSDPLTKNSWEEYDESDVQHIVNRGWLEVRLQGSVVRRVRQEWFDSILHTPLHAMLLDERWGGDRGTLDCHYEAFDDICFFLRESELPPVEPRSRRKRLRCVADYFCLETLVEALDDAEIFERAVRRQLKAASHTLAVKPQASRKTNGRHRIAHDQQAEKWVQEYDVWSQRCSTKAQGVHNFVRTLQRACTDVPGGNGVRAGNNRQAFFGTNSTAKRNRHRGLG
uniref:Uncharacterized protein n=1 Tax=Noctiluca scintillans TaxID=2966 RepID=A0A7S1AIQ3_NOCSC|mmetsp:Transcript_47997/g.127128  ORF Transcript_47997/g.127128 Transcript_47997/m.127128 type:complete len:228 (+) Transcript_47997:31-714(+)